MSIGSWYLVRGRIDRPTFWLKYFLPIVAAGIVASIIDVAVASGSADAAVTSSTAEFLYVPGPVYWVLSLLLLVPSISSSVTRLHDTGRSAWWLLIALVPLVGGIVLIVFWALPGEPRANKYGPPTGASAGVSDPGLPQQSAGQQ